MQLVIFIGIQASGKSSFFKERFFDTHVRINMDMLNTRHREQVLFEACLRGKQPMVIDNTNPSIEDRRRYIEPARAAKFSVTGYYFQSVIDAALARNAARGEQAVPERGVRGTYSKLVLPSATEGFDQRFYVRLHPEGGFIVLPWNDEI